MNQLIYALLAIPMILIVATAVFTQFATNIDRSGWSAEANETYTKVTSGTWTGFNLSSLLPFIYIAVVIVTVILGAFGLRFLGLGE
jgi:ABC-type spermidine/putrescine transport system permease subunit II